MYNPKDKRPHRSKRLWPRRGQKCRAVTSQNKTRWTNKFTEAAAVDEENAHTSLLKINLSTSSLITHLCCTEPFWVHAKIFYINTGMMKRRLCLFIEMEHVREMLMSTLQSIMEGFTV